MGYETGGVGIGVGRVQASDLLLFFPFQNMSNLSLHNALCSDAQLQETPSGREGIPREMEMDLRTYGCRLIQKAGYLLKLFGFSIRFLNLTQLDSLPNFVICCLPACCCWE